MVENEDIIDCADDSWNDHQSEQGVSVLPAESATILQKRTFVGDPSKRITNLIWKSVGNGENESDEPLDADKDQRTTSVHGGIFSRINNGQQTMKRTFDHR